MRWGFDPFLLGTLPSNIAHYRALALAGWILVLYRFFALLYFFVDKTPKAMPQGNGVTLETWGES